MFLKILSPEGSATIKDAIARALQGRRFAFNVERGIFQAVLYRLYRVMASLRTCPRKRRQRPALRTMLRMHYEGLTEKMELKPHQSATGNETKAPLL